jgi:hypothetical protein
MPERNGRPDIKFWLSLFLPIVAFAVGWGAVREQVKNNKEVISAFRIDNSAEHLRMQATILQSQLEIERLKAQLESLVRRTP